MEEFNNLYQKKIDEARAKLSKESREAIDNVNWRLTILGMKNYSSEQLDDLEMETELLLYGITNPEGYPYELQKRMGLTVEDTKLLVEKMHQLVFQKIETELKTILERKNRFENKQSFLDPRFSGLPLSLQRAISKSNWKSTLYEIAQKYQLNIEQMGVLENTTVKVIKNEISGDNYLGELSTSLGKAREELNPLVTDINEKVIMEIKELLKKEQEIKIDTSIENNGGINSFDKIPLPPYSKIKSDRGLEIKPLKMKTDEKTNTTTQTQTNPNNNLDDLKIPEPPKNIIEEKLKGITINNNEKPKNTPITGEERKGDPYREPF